MENQEKKDYIEILNEFDNLIKNEMFKTEEEKKLIEDLKNVIEKDRKNKISEYIINNNERIELNEIGKSSEKNNPPKKKNEKKNNNNTTRTNIDKDLISNDYSLSKNINININNEKKILNLILISI